MTAGRALHGTDRYPDVRLHLPLDPADRSPATVAALGEVGAWLLERWPWLRVVATPTSWGAFDVSLTIDGTYASRYVDSADMVDYFSGGLAELIAAVERTLPACRSGGTR